MTKYHSEASPDSFCCAIAGLEKRVSYPWRPRDRYCAPLSYLGGRQPRSKHAECAKQAIRARCRATSRRSNKKVARNRMSYCSGAALHYYAGNDASGVLPYPAIASPPPYPKASNRRDSCCHFYVYPSQVTKCPDSDHFKTSHPGPRLLIRSGRFWSRVRVELCQYMHTESCKSWKRKGCVFRD
jgi:hypothetical protein